jgi:YidC/Oxa1 family membrane protein insertase
MEKRAIVAALLMAAVLFLYQYLFVPAPDPQKKAKPGATQPALHVQTAPAQPAAPVPVTPLPAGDAPKPPDRIVTVETPLYRAAISSRGGTIQAWDLHFRMEKPMVLPGVVMQRGITVHRPGQPSQPVLFDVSRETLKLDKATPQGELRLVGEDGFGLRVIQTLRFRADDYVVEQQVRVENRHSVAQAVEISLGWTAPAEWPKDHEGFRGPRPISVVRLAEEAFWTRRVWVKDAEEFAGPSRWIGFESGVAPTGQNGVYLTALVPKHAAITATEAVLNGPGQGKRRVEIGLRASVPVLQPGQAWDGQFLQYLGPMEYERLKAFGVGLEKAIYFGGFPFTESAARSWGIPTFPMEWIVVPLLRLMRWFHGYVPNYGVGIIVLTVLTKVLFFPLSLKSMRSMKAMQALQPQINSLRAKYKSDPQRLQRETMELYRQHRVNPLGGCLPMVVQIPIFYALYVMLSVSVDLQNAPFIHLGTLPKWVPWLGGQCLWICDLAAYDPTYVLPLLMGASMFIQQKMTPVVGDPRQAKMMLFMPVLFTFMFLQLPAGLVLYWTLSNVLQIAQQKYMERGGSKVATEKAAARAAKKA